MTSPARATRWVAASVFLLAALALTWAIWPRPSLPQDDNPTDSLPDGPRAYRDITATSGIDFIHKNGEEANQYTILESLGGGVALLDYDGDGLLDIFLTGGGGFTSGGSETDRLRLTGRPGRMYRNLGGGKFTDVTEAVGLADGSRYTHGALVGDFNNDGWPDLLITSFTGMTLYENIEDGKGGRRFKDVSQQVGLTDTRWCTSAAWGDFTGSGRADLYLCRYLNWTPEDKQVCTSKAEGNPRDVCNPHVYKPIPSSLYRWRDGKFVDISPAIPLRTDGKGLGVVVADFNEDGLPDIYVANDAGDNHLYLNRGGGKLIEKGGRAGVAVDDNGRYNGSMGVDVGDYDGSGRASLIVANFQGEYHALYQNLGKERFLYQSQASGLGALGQALVGFGTSFVDFDNDGWLDLFIVHGHVVRYPVGASFRQKPVLLWNTLRHDRRYFRDISVTSGEFFSTPALGRGVAVGDLDNDGWPDLVISHTNSPVVVLRNIAHEAKSAHWLGISLVGKNHRPVAGATLTLEVDGRKLTRFAKSGGSYLSSNDPRILFGLGSAKTASRLTVRWPYGKIEHFDNLATDRYWRIVEGNSTPQPLRAIHP